MGEIVLKNVAVSMIPATVELGGKSPNVFFSDIFDYEDDYLDKCLEGAVLKFFNQGEVCMNPFMTNLLKNSLPVQKNHPKKSSRYRMSIRCAS